MIDTEVIRNKIVDLALKGKLTTHSNSDTDIKSVILEIKTSKCINDYIKNSQIPFEIPANWQWAKLEWLMNIERGGSPRPIKSYITTNEDGINWIKIGDVAKDGKYITETKEKIKPEGEKRSRKVFPGDFLLTNSMSFGRPYISKIEGCIHDGWLVLHNTENIFNLDFLYYLLSSQFVKSQFSQKASGSTVENLNKDKVGESIVPVPPIEEQLRIVKEIERIIPILDNIDDLQARYAADREVLKSKLIDAAIRGKLTKQLPEDGTAEELYQQIQEEKKKLVNEGKIKKSPKSQKIPPTQIPYLIPQNWKWVKLGNALNDVIVPQRDKPKIFDGDIPWCRIEDADGDFMSVSHSGQNVSQKTIKQMNLRVFPKGTVLSACSGASIGRILITTVELCTNQTFNGLVCSKGLYNRYLFYYLKNSIANLKELGSGSAMAYVSQKRIKEMLIPLPPLAEQKRIVEKLDSFIDILFAEV